MPQKISSPANNAHHKALIVVLSIAIMLLVGFVVYFLMSKEAIEKQAKQDLDSQGQTAHLDNSESTSGQAKIYFAKGWQGKYSLVDVETGVSQEFVPEGYEIVNQHEYDPRPRFLILEKDNNLFSYEIENKLLNKIFLVDDLILKSNEAINLYPSITENDKFFIVIHEYDPNEESDMGLPTPINTRSYLFDASINKLVGTSDFDPIGCAEYDSKNQRFFSWPCGEGIGSSIPLSILDLSGKKQSGDIISLAEFGLAADDLGPVALEYNSGLFIALSKNKLDKIVVVDPRAPEVQKETFTVSEAVVSQIQSDLYPYSAALIKSAKTFVIGGGSFIALLRFEGDQINESRIIPEQGLYANFIFPDENFLYYQSRGAKALRAIDLTSWRIVKTLPMDTDEEITIISVAK